MRSFGSRGPRGQISRAERNGKVAEALALAAAAGRVDWIEDVALAATRTENVTLAMVAASRAYLELRDSLDAARRVGVPLAMLGRMSAAAEAAANQLWTSTERFGAVVPRQGGTESARLMAAEARHIERLRALQRELIALRDALFELTVGGTAAGEHERVAAILARLGGIAGALETDLREERGGP